MLRRALLEARSPQVTLVRFARKPIWLPTAPSKLFRIPVRPVIPKSDKEELAALYNHYRTKVRAVRRFLTEEQVTIRSSLANIHSEQSKIEAEKEWDRCFEENDKWNKQIAEERQIYLEQRSKQREEEILAKIIEVDSKHEQEMELVEEKIKIQSKLSETFITRETLEEALEHCFKNESDYNYAIDLEGNYYHGRETNPKNLLSKTFD